MEGGGNRRVANYGEPPIRVGWETVQLEKIEHITVFATEKGVCAIAFTGEETDAARALRGTTRIPLIIERGLGKHASVIPFLREYATGRRSSIETPIHLLGGTPFQRAVWRVLRDIPYGARVSYQWVARHVGRPTATRAVGNAIGKNPVPILIPCHRVIRKDGGLGGFSSGLPVKKALLEIEKRGDAAGDPTR